MSGTTISIICVNDFHAEIYENGQSLGCAKLGTAMEQYKKENPHTIVVFGGDNYRGDPISEQLYGVPVTSFMRRLEVKASAVGNHEFDFGLDMLRRWSKQGDYPFVAANVMDKRTGKLAEGLRPYTIVTVCGVKIAFIGLSTREPLDRLYYPEEVRGLEITDGTLEAKKWVDYLNNGQDPLGRPDLIIALTHYGLKYSADRTTLIGEEVIDLCRRVPEISGVFTAHWHQFVSTQISGIPVVQGGSGGRGAAILRVELTSDNLIKRITPQSIDFSECRKSIMPNLELDRQFAIFKQQAMHRLGEVIGRSDVDIMHKSTATMEVDLEGTPFTRLAVERVSEKTGVPIVLLYAGRMGVGLRKGEWTLYDLYKMFFFNDEIITMKLQGCHLLSSIEKGISTLRQERASPLAVGGLRIIADYSKPYGRRVESITTVGGEAIEPDRYYDIAVDVYLASNDTDYDFTFGIGLQHSGVFLRDTMIQAIKEQAGMTSESSGLVTVKNKPTINP